jgi:hypothetical protein
MLEEQLAFLAESQARVESDRAIANQARDEAVKAKAEKEKAKDAAVRAKEAQARAEQTVLLTYTVQEGDSLWSIARQFYGNPELVELCVTRILRANDLEAADELQVGQELLVPVPTAFADADADVGDMDDWAHGMEGWAQGMEDWSEHMEQWGQAMEDWGESMEELRESDEFQQWEEDIREWDDLYGDEDPDDAPPAPMMPPMPTMPAMPPMSVDAPASVVVPTPMPMPTVPTVPRVRVRPRVDRPEPIRQVDEIQERQEDNRHIIERTETMSAPLDPDSFVEVANEDGSVSVMGADIDVCQVQAVFTLGAETLEAARELSKSVSWEIEPTERGLAIAPVQPDEMTSNQSVNVDFQVLVPRQTDVSVALEDGGILCEHLRGDLSLVVEDGEVTVVDSALSACRIVQEDGEISCDSITGDLSVTLEDGEIDIIESPLSSCAITMEDGEVNCDGVVGDVNVVLADGEVNIDYGDDVPANCAIRVIVEDGQINFSAPREMFGDDSPRVRRDEDSAQWRTSHEGRAVTLQVGDGDIDVDMR